MLTTLEPEPLRRFTGRAFPWLTTERLAAQGRASRVTFTGAGLGRAA